MSYRWDRHLDKRFAKFAVLLSTAFLMTLFAGGPGLSRGMGALGAQTPEPDTLPPSAQSEILEGKKLPPHNCLFYRKSLTSSAFAMAKEKAIKAYVENCSIKESDQVLFAWLLSAETEPVVHAMLSSVANIEMPLPFLQSEDLQQELIKHYYRTGTEERFLILKIFSYQATPDSVNGVASICLRHLHNTEHQPSRVASVACLARMNQKTPLFQEFSRIFPSPPAPSTSITRKNTELLQALVKNIPFARLSDRELDFVLKVSLHADPMVREMVIERLSGKAISGRVARWLIERERENLSPRIGTKLWKKIEFYINNNPDTARAARTRSHTQIYSRPGRHSSIIRVARKGTILFVSNRQRVEQQTNDTAHTPTEDTEVDNAAAADWQASTTWVAVTDLEGMHGYVEKEAILVYPLKP